jgi:hypothetical protein
VVLTYPCAELSVLFHRTIFTPPDNIEVRFQRRMLRVYVHEIEITLAILPYQMVSLVGRYKSMGLAIGYFLRFYHFVSGKDPLGRGVNRT